MSPKPNRSGLSIRTRIILMVIGTLMLAQLISAYLIHRLISTNILAQKITTVEVVNTSVLHDLTYSGNRDLQDSGQQIIAKYMTYYRIINDMAIYSADGLSVAAADSRALHQRTTDPEILAAISHAKPSLHVSRPDLKNFGIRSVAPILQGSRIIGAVVLDVSIQDLELTLATIDRRIAGMMGVMLILVSMALYVLLRGTILLRLRRLMEVTQELTAGNYDIQIEDSQGDEVGRLTRAFNQMAADLRRSKQQIESYNRDLEQRVREATAQLQQAYEELKSTQSQLVLNEKMASLGVLIAGVAHEINTPVGAILNVSRTLEKHLSALPRNFEILKQDAELPMGLAVECLDELRARARESGRPVSIREQRTVEAALLAQGLGRAQERAAVLCRLNFIDAERIAHYAPCFRREAFFDLAESYASIAQAGTISQTSSQKIGEIVRALKYYSHSDNARVDGIAINDSIATALVLLRNQLKHAVAVTTEFDSELPLIPCTSEIHQVWTNLLTNACDAIAESGRGEMGAILVRTRSVGETVVVSVSDNGIGIPAEKMDRIFDPFYTTKDIGKGTGLGLCIVSGIIKRHAGEIRVQSEPGRTTFEILLPIRQPSEGDIADAVPAAAVVGAKHEAQPEASSDGRTDDQRAA